jgi:hypothetical protein
MTTGAKLDKRYAHRERARGDLSVATMTRRLQMCGLSSAEAANLTAHLQGLPAVESGWSARQIAHLLFLRSILETGRLVP